MKSDPAIGQTEENGDRGVPALAVQKTTGAGLSSDGKYVPLQTDSSGNLRVNVAAGGAGDGSILDGVDPSIKATVKDLTNSNPVTVAIVDGSGDQITSFGGGTQYTQGDTDASITGTAMLMEGAADTLLPVQGTVADGLLVNLGANNDVTVTGVSTLAEQQTQTTHLSAIETAVEILDNIVSGNEAQVDIVTMPNVVIGSGTVTTVTTVTAVTAITNALPAGTNNIGDVDVLTLPSCISGTGNPTIDSYNTVTISAAANTANQSLVTAPGANKQIWIYGITGTADTGDGSIALQDEDDTTITGVMELSRRGGFVVTPSGNFSMPWKKMVTNKALEIDTVTCGFKGILQYAVVSV